MKVLIMGATGNQGSAVARHSLKAGLEVYALVRDPQSPKAAQLAQQGVRLVQGDMDKAETLPPAFQGMEAVFSIQNFWTAGHLGEFMQARAVIEAARAAGVRKFIQTTGGINPGQGSANMEVKAIIEALVREAFPGAFILRPVWFIDGLNLTSFNKAEGTFEFVTAPDQPHAWVACDDIGKITAKAFSDFDSFAGRTVNFASAINTANEMVACFNQVFGTSLRYHRFSDEELTAKINSWASASVFRHELDAIFFKNIRTVNFSVDMALHDQLLPDRHTLDSWTREFAYPLWHQGLTEHFQAA